LKPIVTKRCLKTIFWDNEELTFDEKSVLIALILIAQDNGVLYSHSSLLEGFMVPATINGIASELGKGKRKNKISRIIKNLIQKGYILQKKNNNGYQLVLNQKRLFRKWVKEIYPSVLELCPS
jgi:hypothetical protein